MCRRLGENPQLLALVGIFEASEIYTFTNMKRDNLVYLFLTDTGVDRYVATHLYGLVQKKNALTDQEMIETSLVEKLDLDETFTH